MGKIIAVANQKGGVGKTTTAISLASGLGMRGKKILLVDLDPQFNASIGVGYDVSRDTKSIYDVLLGEANLEDVVSKEIKPNVDLIPSSIDLAAADAILLEQKENQQNLLKNELEKLKEDYDFIIIDCPPSLGLINRNGLTSADSILIPIQAEHYAMHGVAQLLRTIKKVKETLNPRLTIEGVLVTMHDQRTRLSSDVLDEVKNTFGSKVYQVVIPRNIKIAETSIEGKSIFEYDKNGTGAIAYAKFVDEVLKENGN